MGILKKKKKDKINSVSEGRLNHSYFSLLSFFFLNLLLFY